MGSVYTVPKLYIIILDPVQTSESFKSEIEVFCITHLSIGTTRLNLSKRINIQNSGPSGITQYAITLFCFSVNLINDVVCTFYSILCKIVSFEVSPRWFE